MRANTVVNEKMQLIKQQINFLTVSEARSLRSGVTGLATSEASLLALLMAASPCFFTWPSLCVSDEAFKSQAIIPKQVA